jgi:uncharacterized membrane protein YfcA
VAATPINSIPSLLAALQQARCPPQQYTTVLRCQLFGDNASAFLSQHAAQGASWRLVLRCIPLTG